MSLHWGDRVAENTRSLGDLAVGIDPVLDDIPFLFRKDHLEENSDHLDRYLNFVLEVVAPHVGFVKFQAAFFEAFGSAGLASLARAISNAKKRNLGIILDAKRGDIGTTASAYAKAYLTPSTHGGTDLEVDCMTINPFLGPETLEPFVDCARRFGKGLFILAKTSNPGAGWLQDQEIGGSRVSDRIAKLIGDWADETIGSSGISAVGAVVGATFPEDGLRLRKLMPHSVFLAPGIGPQGGNTDGISSLRGELVGSVLVPVSRGITKVDNLDLSEDDYGESIQKRILALKVALS